MLCAPLDVLSCCRHPVDGDTFLVEVAATEVAEAAQDGEATGPTGLQVSGCDIGSATTEIPVDTRSKMADLGSQDSPVRQSVSYCLDGDDDLRSCDSPSAAGVPGHPSHDVPPGADVVAGKSHERLRDRTRRLHRHVTRKISRACRRHMSWYVASKSVPAPETMPIARPLVWETLPGVRLEDVHAALSCPRECVTLQYLDMLGCHVQLTSGWNPCPDNTEHVVRKIVYEMPIPSDVPPAMAKLIGVPKTLQGSTVQRLWHSDDEVKLVQHAYSRGMMHGDRFLVQSIMNFRRSEKGGVEMRQWVDPIWTGSLPWTLGAVKTFVEKKVKAEALSHSAGLVSIVRACAGRCQDRC